MLSCSAGHAAISDNVVRIGVLTDTSSIYADTAGTGSIVAVQMAAEDFMRTHPIKIEVLSADHQNKADIGAAIARKWFDEDKVDAVTDLTNSSVALAVSEIARERRKAVLVTAAASMAITGKSCSPTTINWTWDNYSTANAFSKLVDSGLKRWYFITVDYAFGHDLENLLGTMVRDRGGEVVGSVQYPLGTQDFSSFILQAQVSNAQVVAFLNGGADATNSVKQAKEFRLENGGKKIVLGGAVDLDLENLGLQAAQGLYLVSTFYWDRTESTREWTKRFAERHNNGKSPTMIQAGAYAAVWHYLKAVASAGSDDGLDAVNEMKKIPTDDPLFGKGHIRPDGRTIHDVYVWQAKTPAESKDRWDILKLVETVPGDQAFQPIERSDCPLVQKR
jgi:branched-chain amino acid transport system substrate-binding protein